jgi:cyclic beta-1,2-glucan synthetase
LAAADDDDGKSAALETSARALADTQRELVRSRRSPTRLAEPSPVTLALEHAQRHLAATHAGNATLPKAAEWFLDNYYLIRRVARQVDDELPRGFVRHLPELASGSSRGRLRIEALAEAVVSTSRLELDASTVRRFVDAYQEVSPLTIAELWALPTMLRESVLSQLVQFLDRLHVPIGDEHASRRDSELQGRRDEALSLDPGVGVELATRALRLLVTMDW